MRHQRARITRTSKAKWGKHRHVRHTFWFVGHQPSSQLTFIDERFAGVGNLARVGAGDLARAAAGDLVRAAAGDLVRAVAGDLARAVASDLARAVAGDLARAEGVLALADGDLRAAPKQNGVSGQQEISNIIHWECGWSLIAHPSIHPGR